MYKVQEGEVACQGVWMWYYLCTSTLLQFLGFQIMTLRRLFQTPNTTEMNTDFLHPDYSSSSPVVAAADPACVSPESRSPDCSECKGKGATGGL